MLLLSPDDARLEGRPRLLSDLVLQARAADRSPCLAELLVVVDPLVLPTDLAEEGGTAGRAAPRILAEHPHLHDLDPTLRQSFDFARDFL